MEIADHVVQIAHMNLSVSCISCHYHIAGDIRSIAFHCQFEPGFPAMTLVSKSLPKRRVTEISPFFQIFVKIVIEGQRSPLSLHLEDELYMINSSLVSG